MMMGNTIFRFYLAYIAVDSSGYYYARWDREVDIEILAQTEDEAGQKLLKVLGKCARPGFEWTYRVKRIAEETTVGDATC